MSCRALFGYLLLLAICLTSSPLKSQYTVTPANSPGITPLQLVQDHLLGTGVTVSNVTFNGSSGIIGSPQAGFFTAQRSALVELGLASGTMLCSGKVTDTQGPSSQMASTNLNKAGDPDLNILCATVTHDAAILEFDFVPQSDQVTFRYVFGSEELYSYCHEYNDPFGFFISGPGITGTFSNNSINIALMPMTTLPVTINNLCDDPNSNWCNNACNNCGTGPNTHPPPPRVTYQICSGAIGENLRYDGFTYVYSATLTVIPCQTYHIKLAVADAADYILDSGVFLEENSFSSNSFVPNINFSNTQTGELLVAGCNDLTLFYQLQEAKTSDFSIDISIDPTSSAAQADILPNPLPNPVIIPAGQLQSPPVIIQVVPAASGPDKTLIINATATFCTTILSQSIFTLKYNTELSVALAPQTICSGIPAILSPVVTGGQTFVPTNEYHYLWSDGSATPSITVSPGMGHHVYDVTVSDACNQSIMATTSVDVGTVPPATGAIAGETAICLPAAGKIYAVAPVAGADHYIWALPPGGTIAGPANGNSITVDFDQNTVAGNITVIPRNIICGDGPATTLPITANPNPVVSFTSCNITKTTKNGRPIILKGGLPLGGIYTAAAGVNETSPGSGIYTFNPADPGVIAGSSTGSDYTITYRYTSSLLCADEKNQTLKIYPSNATGVCPGWVTDVRDNLQYPTFLSGTGNNARCWMAENLNYGEYFIKTQIQTDNCIAEKYCQNDLTGQCSRYGGYYQWDELMGYTDISGIQDICPPGWHVPSETEWQQLMTDVSTFGAALAGGFLKEPGPIGFFAGKTSGLSYLNELWSFTTDPASGVMFWTSTAGNPHKAFAHGLNQVTGSVSFYQSSKTNAFPVRCVKD